MNRIKLGKLFSFLLGGYSVPSGALGIGRTPDIYSLTQISANSFSKFQAPYYVPDGGHYWTHADSDRKVKFSIADIKRYIASQSGCEAEGFIGDPVGSILKRCPQIFLKYFSPKTEAHMNLCDQQVER